ncbi:MAG: S8 family peptidase [Desulfurococcaceae archaeon]
MRSLVIIIGLLLFLLTGLILTQVNAWSDGAHQARIIVGVKPGHDFDNLVRELKSYGRVVNTIPEIGAVVLIVPGRAIGILRNLPSVKYIEEDILVKLEDDFNVIYKVTSTGRVFFSSYTDNIIVNAGETSSVNYTVKNNIRSSIDIVVELYDYKNNLVTLATHTVSARKSVSGSLYFTAPQSPGNYSYKLTLRDASTGATYDSKLIIVSVYQQTLPEPSPPPGETPQQPLYYTDKVNWNINYVKAPDVWHTYNTTYGLGALGYGIQVAVLDTGIDYTHLELQGAVVWCAVYLDMSGIIYEGHDLSMCMDRNGHGTHVAGIIRASMNNVSIVGVSPFVQLYAIKVLGDSGSGYISDIAKGIIEAVKGPDDIAGTEDDADVISMSLGGPASQTLYNAVKYAYDNGVVLVAAAGNSGASNPSYPAAYPEVIAVGAVDSNYQVPSWSNRNPDVVAPGVGIYSTIPGGTLGYKSGTSMACPHVSGVAALIQALRVSAGKSKLTPSQVISLIKQSAIDLGATGYDELYGYGLVDAYRAIQLALTT